LLDDVLLFGKAEAGKLQFQPKRFDLMAFCQDLVEEMQFSAGSNYQITFSGSRSCKNAYMDERLIQHILTNLLSNAIKYSPTGGKINLELDCEQQIAIFQIQDSGIGIPIMETPNLFKPFERANNVGTLSGTGLGLAIVKNCVDVHGGKISVESELGVGTKFIVNLPYYKELNIAS
jgi:signal transduction histidine kinase